LSIDKFNELILPILNSVVSGQDISEQFGQQTRPVYGNNQAKIDVVIHSVQIDTDDIEDNLKKYYMLKTSFNKWKRNNIEAKFDEKKKILGQNPLALKVFESHLSKLKRKLSGSDVNRYIDQLDNSEISAKYMALLFKYGNITKSMIKQLNSYPHKMKISNLDHIKHLPIVNLNNIIQSENTFTHDQLANKIIILDKDLLDNLSSKHNIPVSNDFHDTTSSVFGTISTSYQIGNISSLLPDIITILKSTNNIPAIDIVLTHLEQEQQRIIDKQSNRNETSLQNIINDRQHAKQFI